MIHELEQVIHFAVNNKTTAHEVKLNVYEEKLELNPEQEGTLTVVFEPGDSFSLKFDANQPLALILENDNVLIQDDTLTEWQMSIVGGQHIFTRPAEDYNQVFTITIHPPTTEPPMTRIIVVGTVEINDGKA